MTEILHMLRHAFGLCGEGHPNLLLFVGMFGTIWYVVKHKAKWCYKKGCSFCTKAYRKVRDKS